MSGKNMPRILVIGANAAGLKAASRCRRLLPAASIIVIDHCQYISYGACGMPYFVSGDVPSVDRLRETPYGVIRDPEFFERAKGVEVIVQSEVKKIDRGARKVTCESILTGETKEYPYDKLILAAGSTPVLPPGVPRQSARVSTFKVLEDSITLKEALKSGHISTVAIIGAGATGCELADALAVWGVHTLLLDAAPHILPAMLDSEMARPIEAYLESEGVEIHTNCLLKGIVESDQEITLRTSEAELRVDHAIFAIGVRPNTRLAGDCGLTIGATGGIVVDERMTTSDKDIFAAGDCVELKHLVSGSPVVLPLGSLANRQGRVVGSNLGGGDERFGPVVGSAAVKIFDMNVAATGLTERAAREAGYDVGMAWGTFTDKSDYYPGRENLYLKLVYDKKTTRLLGLQGYSKGEVAKRVDVYSALLKHGEKLEGLLDSEFAYSPPYAPALDPLYSLACAARNELLEGVQALSPDANIDDYLVIHVRRTKEASERLFREQNTKNIPFEQFRCQDHGMPNAKGVVCVCSKGARASEAVRILQQEGRTDVKYLGGGSLMKVAGE